MVFKRSEYGLKYKKSYLENNIPVYYNNVAYRTHRRELEHAHTPLSWDFEDTSDSRSSPEEDISLLLQNKLKLIEENFQQGKIIGTGENDQHGRIEATGEKEDLVHEAKTKLEKYESKGNRNTDGKKTDVSKLDQDTQFNEDNLKQSKLNEEKTFCKDNQSGSQKDDLKLSLQSDEDKKKKKTRPSTRARPKSSPVYKPPFLAYGCGDRERETGVKRSFNVRASNDVYPAAMKALVNLHEQQKKREKNRRCLSARERKRKALIQEKAGKEVAGWQSEYQRMYPQYNYDEYARSASRLQNRPQCFKPYKF